MRSETALHGHHGEAQPSGSSRRATFAASSAAACSSSVSASCATRSGSMHGHNGCCRQVVQRAAVAQEARVERRLADALPVVHALHVLPHAVERVRVDGGGVQQGVDGLQRLRVDGVVERGRDRDAPDRLRRALRQRVEGADVLDDVAEKLDPDGRGLALGG